MSNYFQISNQYKKSYTEQQDWKKDGKGLGDWFVEISTYRFGEIIIKTDMNYDDFSKKINQISKDNEERFSFVSDSLEDFHSDWEFIDYGDISEQSGIEFEVYSGDYSLEDIEEMYDEDSDWEGHGFTPGDILISFYGPIDVKDISGEYN